MTQGPNDCAICAVLNAGRALGIEADRDEIRRATRYDPNHGGDPVEGLRYLATRFGLEYERFPLYDDLQWEQVNEHIKIARPEANKERLFSAYLKRLEEGWVAATQIRLAENAPLDHAIALIGISDGKIQVACSMRGVYEAGSELFQGPAGKLQAGIFTGWAKKERR